MNSFLVLQISVPQFEGFNRADPKTKAESSLWCNILPILGNTCQAAKRGGVCTPTMLQLSKETEDKSRVKQADSRPFPNSKPCFTPCSSHKADLHLKRVNLVRLGISGLASEWGLPVPCLETATGRTSGPRELELWRVRGNPLNPLLSPGLPPTYCF